jgi:hypothetical protein
MNHRTKIHYAESRKSQMWGVGSEVNSVSFKGMKSLDGQLRC